nr:flavonol synthase/flavanone 3-hydroxylase-like [Malus domestica]
MGSYTDVALVQEEVVVPPTFGSSLQTPNVLEIAKINPLHVPERYLLKNQCRRARIICVSFLRRFLPLISLCFQVGTRRSLPNYAWLAKNGASSRDAIETYSGEVKKVGEELIRALSLIMGMEKDSLLGLHKRIRKEGEWAPVKPIPNPLVVNVGDVIEIWSNGKYKSIEHRAATTEGQARLSYATFLIPHDDVEIEPFDHMMDCPRSVWKYKKVRCGDDLRESLKMKMNGKAHTQVAKIET